MNRIEAIEALFGDDPSLATQEAVDLIKGNLDLSQDEKDALDEDVVDDVAEFQTNPAMILGSLQDDNPKKALLQQLAPENTGDVASLPDAHPDGPLAVMKPSGTPLTSENRKEAAAQKKGPVEIPAKGAHKRRAAITGTEGYVKPAPKPSAPEPAKTEPEAPADVTAEQDALKKLAEQKAEKAARRAAREAEEKSVEVPELSMGVPDEDEPEPEPEEVETDDRDDQSEAESIREHNELVDRVNDAESQLDRALAANDHLEQMLESAKADRQTAENETTTAEEKLALRIQEVIDLKKELAEEKQKLADSEAELAEEKKLSFAAKHPLFNSVEVTWQVRELLQTSAWRDARKKVEAAFEKTLARSLATQAEGRRELADWIVYMKVYADGNAGPGKQIFGRWMQSCLAELDSGVDPRNSERYLTRYVDGKTRERETPAST